jgi:nucleoside phosphorylase
MPRSPNRYNKRMSKICLVTALPAEAQPLVEHFKLRQQQHPGMRVWFGDDHCLLQTGVGKLAASAQLARLLQSSADIIAVINVGICGAERPLGDVLMAHSVTDDGSGRHWFPHLPAQRNLPACDTLELRTLDTAGLHYSATTMLDMEASGIATAATAHLDMAFVQFVKAVSDNSEQPAHSVSKAAVGPLITACLPLVEQLSACLRNTALENITAGIEPLVEELTRRCHHTVTEGHALRRLLQRHQALRGNIPGQDSFLSCTSANDVRDYLQHQIDAAGLKYCNTKTLTA